MADFDPKTYLGQSQFDPKAYLSGGNGVPSPKLTAPQIQEMVDQYGEVRVPSTWEKVKLAFDNPKWNPFASGPSAPPLHSPGIKATWKDVSSSIGANVAATLTNPGNLILTATGAPLAEAAPKIARLASGIFGGWMAGSAAMQIPRVYREIKDPKVDAAQAAADAIGIGTRGALGLLGIAGSMVKPGSSAELIPQEITGKSVSEASKVVLSHATGQDEPTAQAAIETASEALQNVIPAHLPELLESEAESASGEESVKKTENDSEVPGSSNLEKESIEKTEPIQKAIGEAGTPQPQIQVSPAEVPANVTLKQRIMANLGRISGMMDRNMAMRAYYEGQQAAAEGVRRFTEKNFRELDSQSRRDSEEIKNDLLKTAAMLPMKERGRFTRMIVDAASRPAIGRDPGGMYRRAMNVSLRLMAHADQVERNGLAAEIMQTLDRVQKSPSVDVKYKRFFQHMADRISKQAAGEPMEPVVQNEAGEDTGTEGGDAAVSEMGRQAKRLSSMPLREMPASVLASLRDRMKLLEKLGREQVKNREALYESEKAALISDLSRADSHAADPARIEVKPGEKSGKMEALSRATRNLAAVVAEKARNGERSLLPRDVVMDILDNNADGKGPINRIFGGRFDWNYNVEMQIRREFRDRLASVIERNGNFSKLERERLSIYAASRQENGIEHLLSSQVPLSLISKIQAEGLTPREMDFYNATMSLGEDIYPRVAQLMRELYNVDVKKVPNYSPFLRDYRFIEPAVQEPRVRVSEGGERNFDEMATWRQLENDFVPPATSKAQQGMTKTRLDKASGAIKLDYLAAWERHINQVSHLLANQRDLKMLGEIARSDLVRKKYGSLGQKYLTDFIDTVARNGDPSGAQRISWLDFLNRNSSVGILGLRLVSQLKHLPNVAIALREVSPNFMAMGIHEAMTPGGWNFVNRYFAEIAHRWGGEPAIADIGAANAWRKLQSGSFFIERGIDAGVARGTVLGAYFEGMHRAGIDPSAYLEIEPDTSSEAWRNALLVSRKVVTSPLPKDLPQAISRGSLFGKQMSLSRTFFQFQNTMLRQYGYARHEIFDLGFGEGNPIRATTALLAFMAVIAGESELLHENRKVLGYFAGINPKTEDERHPYSSDFEHETLRRLPFAGNFMSTEYGRTGIPVVDMFTEGMGSAIHLEEGKNEYGGKLSDSQRKKMEAQTLGTAGEFLGIPATGTVANIYSQTIPKVKKGDTLQSLYERNVRNSLSP